MTRRSIGIVAAVAVAVSGYFLWLYIRDPSVTVRYRLTLEMEADGKPVSGSSVMEVKVVRGLSNIGAPYGIELCGEAVVVDLGRHGMLFGILRGQPELGFPFEMLAERVFGRTKLMPAITEVPSDQLDIERVWRLQRVPENTGEIELLPSEIPQLVRFRDINDSATAELVSLANLPKLYAGNVRFLGAMLARTNESVTEKIAASIPQILKGLEPFNRVVIDPRPINSLRLGTGDFNRSR